MQQRSIGPFRVSAIGLGCMNLSHAYGAPPAPEAAERLLLKALDRGVTMFDTAALYGFGANETLVGRVLKPHRSKFVLASKGGNPEIGVLQTCRDIGAAFVAFSPTARGFLTGTLRDVSTFDAKDIRRGMSRFEPANHAANRKLLDGLAPLATEAGCSMVQLALAWLLAQASNIVPIPGTTSIAHLEENLGADAVTVSPTLLQRAAALINRHTVTGARYNATSQTEVDTEEF